MNRRFLLPCPYLWTRESAIPHREDIERHLEALENGCALVVDAQHVEVFDVSFAAELFGRILLTLPRLYPGRFFAVENLKPNARENLLVTLERMNLVFIELVDWHLQLLGNIIPLVARRLMPCNSSGRRQLPLSVTFRSKRRTSGSENWSLWPLSTVSALNPQP